MKSAESARTTRSLPSTPDTLVHSHTHTHARTHTCTHACREREREVQTCVCACACCDGGRVCPYHELDEHLQAEVKVGKPEGSCGVHNAAAIRNREKDIRHYNAPIQYTTPGHPIRPMTYHIHSRPMRCGIMQGYGYGAYPGTKIIWRRCDILC